MKRRSTPAKDAILSVLTGTGKAMSQDAIGQQIDMEMDRATIYRVLNRFCDDGILHRIVAEDGKQYFALCSGCDEKKHADQHFHFRCTSCDTIECLTAPVHFAVPKGYKVNQVNCVLTGSCKNCT